MPRGNRQNNNYRVRGGSRGRGRGRGRGGPNHTTPPAFAASRAPRHAYSHMNDEIDVVIQQWPQPSNAIVPGPSANGVSNANRWNGPWRGGTPKSRSGAGTPARGSTPRGRGRGGGRGRGQGRGWGLDDARDIFIPSRRPRPGVGKVKKTIGKDGPLSDLLYAERPLLRPVKFVRATLTPFLFQHSEDMLKPAVEVADTTETSHVPTADRVARLFQLTETGPDTASDSDSESEYHAQDGLEEIDFADLAQLRAEVDAIAQGTTTATIDRDAYEHGEDLEVVDFADLAAILAKVDATELRVASQDDVVEEAFTGVYNQIKGTTQPSSTADVVGDDQQSGVPQTLPLSKSPTLDNSLHLQPSNKISNPSHHESITHDQGPIVIEEESFNALPIEQPAISIHPTREKDHALCLDDIPPHSDEPSHDAHPLFVVDTAPTRPFLNTSASDVILVDRTGHGETLGDQDEELIVYVAPHPRSSRASSESPTVTVPRVKLPKTSMLTGRDADPEVQVGGLRSPVREDDVGPIVSNQERICEGPAEVGEEPPLSLASLTLGPTSPAAVSTASATAPLSRPTSAALRSRKKAVQIQRHRQRQNKRSMLGFGAYGAMMSEARLREEDARERRRPRWETRRRGDSDLDWGTDEDEDEDETEDRDRKGKGKAVSDEVDVVSDGFGGMEPDPDLELDLDAMQGFLKSMGAEGSRFVTMDDIADEARMRQEDEDLGGPDGSSDSELSDDEEAEEDEDEEEDEVFDLEEQILIAESEGDEELSEDSDDDELSPTSSFQARLRKVRERSRAQRPITTQGIPGDEEGEEEEDAPEFLPWTRSAKDEAFIARMNDLIEEHSRNVETYIDDPEYTTPVNKKAAKKGKNKQPTEMDYLTAKLQVQWAKDRAKKAARKQERRAAQLHAALDPLSAARNGNKDTRVSRKAMRKVARLDPEARLAIAPRAIVDVVSLEAQLRRFVEGSDWKVDGGPGNDREVKGDGDRGSKPHTSIALPPMDRATRKAVHELAAAFGIESVSKGKGAARYTTLIRTTRTGVGVNEDKVRALVKKYGWMGMGPGGKGRGKKGGKGGRVPGHREGDEVGKEAPKIGESNIGFRMLASMGWSEGDRIGSTTSVGIEAPLTAIIKHSKLGLGATR